MNTSMWVSARMRLPTWSCLSALTIKQPLSTVLKVNVLVTQPCLTLCDPMDCRPTGSSVHGILQARTLEWLPFPSPGDLPNPGIEPGSPAFQADS